MKILSLEAENIKRLVAVYIKPDGNLVQITGRNGSGKSSCLDAIWWALEGTSHIQAKPIRKGAHEAFVKLDLGELKVTRKFKAQEGGGYTTSITAENEDGARFSSPQTMLDELVGALSFDPLEFTRQKPAAQFELLRSFVKGFNFEEADELNRVDYDERTRVNRDAKEKRSQAEGIVITGDVPTEVINTADLVAELEKAGEHNAMTERTRGVQEARYKNLELLKSQLSELEAQRDDIDTRIKETEGSITITEQAIGAEHKEHVDPIDTSAIREKIEASKQLNDNWLKLAERRKLNHLAQGLEEESAMLTRKMKNREQVKHEAIEAAEMPVEGLGFSDEGTVLLNGVPFAQGSDAEQLRTSVAIAAAMNPKLRVIRIRDGSLLDEDGLKLLAEFADANNLQVWLERVTNGEKVGFQIEDGQVA